MLGKKKKSALEQFQKNAAGDYVYTGKHYGFVSGEKSRKRALVELWVLSGAMGACSLGAGMFPAPGTVNTFYVLIPMAAAMISAMAALWALGQLSAGGDPLKEYVYEASVVKLPGRLMAVTVFSVLMMACELLYLILNGGWGRAVIGVLVLEAAAAVLAQVTKRTFSCLEWQENG